MPRLFIAIDLPERIKDDLTGLYTSMEGARWVDEDQLHVTLRFIGEIAGDAEASVTAALRQVTAPPFSLTIKGVGFFPPRKEPHILWTGIAESEELLRLQARIERAVVSAGVPPDGRKFHAHITIARLNGTHPHRTAQFITQNSLFATEEFSVSAFHLYSSVLRKEGPVHTLEESFPLHSGGM